MASASPFMDVEEELQCPICMEYLTYPVTLDCGHNFCRGCITHYCKKWEELGDFECPLCKARIKKGNFRPNWQLANIVEKIKRLNLGQEDLCVRHKKKLNLFCKDDQELVCVGCERSPAHQLHTVLLLEDAALEYGGQLRSCLEVLRKERERILAMEAETEKESQELLRQIEGEKTKTEAGFNQLHQFLEEQKMLFLSQMEELEKEIERRREEHMARLLGELASLGELIQQMEEKCQQPASELLQDIRRTLLRYEKKEWFENPVVFPPELICRIREFHDVNPFLEVVTKQFPAEELRQTPLHDQPRLTKESHQREVSELTGKVKVYKPSIKEPENEDGNLQTKKHILPFKMPVFEKGRKPKPGNDRQVSPTSVPGKEDLCMRHEEKLNLFCEEDQELVCLFCEQSPEHQSHTVLLLGEAARECRGQLCSCLEVLRKEQERILENKSGTEKESRDLLSQIEAAKTKRTALFNQLHQFLEEQKTRLHSQMEEQEKEIATRREEHMARLVEGLSSHEGLIQQMEEKCQQPTSELLQDVGSTLQRWEDRKTFENPAAFPSALKWSWEFCGMTLFLEGVIKQFKGTLASEPQVQKANVTLDPDTAHRSLILCEDCKSVRWGWGCQTLPDNPERFDTRPIVLGREGFTSGRHFWEVAVGSEERWIVGVARKSVRRKGWFAFSPEEGTCAVGKWGDQYKVLNPPDYTLLSVSQELKRILVVLNCDGQVAFFDADTGIRIYTYSGLCFCGEIILPLFYVFYKAHLKLPS